MRVWFDEEGDFLEVTSKNKEGFFKDMGNGIFERIDKKGNVIGFAVLNIRKRKDVHVPFEIKFKKKISA